MECGERVVLTAVMFLYVTVRYPIVEPVSKRLSDHHRNHPCDAIMSGGTTIQGSQNLRRQIQ